ncbi:IS3 family transposase [Histomonas meleagridis]|nr:IS3 family transposase [Histomonas meleagridis]
MKKNSSNDDPRNGIDIQAFRQSINDNGTVKGNQRREVNFCLDYKDKYHVGYQRTAESAKRHNIATTEWSVRKIFTEQKLLCYKKPEKLPKEHLRLFVAKYANQLWHADIHYVTIEGEQFYLLGFIDDRSRFLIYYEVLSSKTSEACATALIKALGSVVHRPKMLTIDNGGEFTGNPFQFILQLYGIEDYRTHPYTPEENGKIERFWLTIERAKGPNVAWSIPKINSIIHEYNYFWTHRSLRKLTHQSSTPYEAWRTMDRYTGQTDACIEMIK